MARITPEQWAAQWANLGHKFQVNVHNFEVKAGKAAVEVFKESFDRHRFNSQGSRAWPRWQGKYSSRGSLLNEFGLLKESIKVKGIRSHTVTIHSDPNSYARHRRHPGFCFAQVHNNLNTINNKPLRGPKKERQFIGHSTVLKRELEQLNIHIFDGFPINV